MIAQTLFWFCAAVVLAALEIEIEGKFGWAEKLPTWYRTQGGPARIFGLLSSGKPLTGYHLFLQLLIVLMLHMPFFYGLPWTGSAELLQLAFFLLLWLMEDFAWFILNPDYGISQFRKDRVWWFAKSLWVKGKFPFDYVIGALLVQLLVTFAGLIAGKMPVPAWREAWLLLGQALLLMVPLVLVAPFYHTWHRHMRKTDDRDKAGIFHRE